VSPVRYELGFYIPEDDILHSDRREKLKSYLMFWVIVMCGHVETDKLKREWGIAINI
jgi:hypothetical protein